MHARLIGWRRWAAAGLLASLVACGSGGDGDGEDNDPARVGGPTQTRAVTVTGPQDSAITVPAGGLGRAVPLTVTLAAAGAPAVPAGVQRASEVYAITPHDTRFKGTARVRLRYDPALIPAGVDAMLWKASPGGGWEVFEAASAQGGVIEADVPSLSYFMVAARPFGAFVVSQAPAIDVDYELPDANGWSSQPDLLLGYVSTLTRPSDVVLRTRLRNAPPCAAGWSVGYGVRAMQYAEAPAASGWFTLFWDGTEPALPVGSTTVDLGGGNYRTVIPWQALAPVNNRVDMLEVTRALASTVSAAVSPGGSTFVGFASAADAAGAAYADDPGLAFLRQLFTLLGLQPGQPRPPAVPPPQNIWVENSQVRSLVAELDGPTVRCAGMPFPVASGSLVVARSVFATTGHHRIGIRRHPEAATFANGQVATFSVELIGAGAAGVPVTVDWYRAAAGSALFLPVGRSDTQVTQGTLYGHSQPIGMADDGSRWRAVACAVTPPGARSDCIESNTATLSVTP